MSHKWRENDPFDREFDLSSYDELREYTSLAFRECNLGNKGDWYGHFLGGYSGMKARLYGVQRHFYEIHAWLPRERTLEEFDYHLATILFGMDSAVECLTYALNAMGWAVAPSDFKNITDDDALGEIKPANVYGGFSKKGNPLLPVAGYAQIFPEVQRYWQEQQGLLAEIINQHDVSKHRMATLQDGMKERNDPPDRFFEELLITDELDRQVYTPKAEFYLLKDAKRPNERAQAGQGVTVFHLEEVVKRFRTFIAETGRYVLLDTKAHIPLKYDTVLAVDKAMRARQARAARKPAQNSARKAREEWNPVSVQMNTATGEQITAFWLRVLELYDLLLQRRRKNAGTEAANVQKLPTISPDDPEAMMDGAQARLDAVLNAPELTGGEKNALLRIIVEKIVPHDDRIEFTWR